MNGMAGQTLPELLRGRNPDLGQVIDHFIVRFNAVYGDPATVRWDISTEDWQRFEFLGDRVLNLVVAQILFTRRGSVLDEGEMTKVLSSVVSNQSLSALAGTVRPGGFSRLIPGAIAEQNNYGERITGGAFEAFIGALYCEAGLDDVACFITAILSDALDQYDPQGNAIGILQEYYQKKGMPVPAYELVTSSGPAHRPHHTYRVHTPDGKSFNGEGKNSQEAKQKAARAALNEIGKKAP